MSGVDAVDIPEGVPQPPAWAIKKYREKQKRLANDLDKLLNCCVCGENIRKHRGIQEFILCPRRTGE